MELTDRQRKVLYCIVKEYIQTRNPVSSRKVIETATIDRSGATVRNDMNRLMKLGYIFQPHTSAGRVPTDKGLRFYVDELLKIREEVRHRGTQVETAARFPIGDMEKVLNGAAKLLSSSTAGFVVIEKPSPLNLRIRRIVLTPVSEGFSIASIITTLGLSSSIPVQHGEIGDPVEVENALNKLLIGLTLSEFRSKLRDVLGRLNDYATVLGGLSRGIFDIIERLSFESYEEYVSEGLQNIFTQERLNPKKIPTIIAYVLSDGFRRDLFELNDGVYVGKEHGLRLLEDFSVMLGSFRTDESNIGRVGLVFDKYGNYDSIIDSFEFMLNRLSEYFTVVSRSVGS